jgi:asparagine synthase (glutamine-hydrolysing)
MFAFAFFDLNHKTVLLARDRFGMKPLYTYQDESCFAFASEVKAFKPWFALEPEPFSIASYLLGFGGPTKGFTFYKHVQSVAPGSMVVLETGRSPSQTSFFSIPEFLDREQIESLDRLKPLQMVDKMEELLLASVSKHMFADAPVGAFCSGGVDSSLLMAMAARIHNNLAIFHANVKGSWSEYHAALALSKHLKLDLKSVDVEDRDFIHELPEVMRHYEHPYTYHPNCAPLLLVSKLVRENRVKGMLSGEGSDECFLGYPWFARQRIVDTYYRCGAQLRTQVHKVPAVGKILWPYRGTGNETVKTLFNRCEINADEKQSRAFAASIFPNGTPTGTLQSLDYLNYHLRTLLHRNDCLGMAASIEARFPFLDNPLVATAVNMPDRFKLRFEPTVLEKAHPFYRDKWVVRKVADRYIPRKLSRRIKIGFWTTVFHRMRVAPKYFENSFTSELFETSREQINAIGELADQELGMRLLHLDIWGDVCLRDHSDQQVLEKLNKHVRVAAE